MINKIIVKLKMLNRIRKFNKNNQVSYKAIINEKSKLNGNNVIYRNVKLYDTLVGEGTYIGQNSMFTKSIIGKYCSISENVKVIMGCHPTEKYVSTHPLFYTNRKFGDLQYCDKNKFEEYKYADNRNKTACIIENDVWIGQDVKIMNGVRVGNGAIIGTGAIVTKDVEPYSIVVGVPAKVIRYRFEKADIDYLLSLRWWDKPDSWLKSKAEKFEDIELLKLEDRKVDK